jgi:hypothetical protein
LPDLLLLQGLLHLAQVVTQVVNIAQWYDHMPFHRRVEVVPATVRAELRQAGIDVELGFVEPVKADAMFDQELLQVRELASAGIVVVELQDVGSVDIRTDFQQFLGTARRKLGFAPVECQLFLSNDAT